MNTYIKHSEDDSLTHYGIKGMKWKKGRKTPIKNPFSVNERGFISQEEIEAKKKRGDKYLRGRSELVKIKGKQISKSLKKKGNRALSSAKKAVDAGKKKLSSLGGKKEIKKNPAASASKKTIKKVANKTKAAYGTLKIIDKAVKAYPAKHWAYDTTDADFDVKTKKKRYVSRASKRTYTHKSKESKTLYPFRLK